MKKAILDIRGVTIEVYTSSIEIRDSFRVRDNVEKIRIIQTLLGYYPELSSCGRNLKNMLREWQAHNILFQHNYQMSRTKDVYFELKQSLKYKIGYFIISLLFKEKD